MADVRRKKAARKLHASGVAEMSQMIFEERIVAMVPIRIAPAVQAKRDQTVSEGKCLSCQGKHTKDEQVRRGLCEKCYQAFRRAINQQLADEKELLKEGRILPKSKGGRPISNPFTKSLQDN
jgi:protein-arginine kinase activator protein McsA